MRHTLPALLVFSALAGGCFGAHPDDGEGLCSAQDAFGEGLCNAVLGYKFDGTECISFSGCSCVGADCDATFNSLGACQDACAADVPSPGECAAQDATGTGGCRLLVGFAFNGERCVSVDCECEGADCDAVFETFDACESSYADCIASGPTDPSEPDPSDPDPSDPDPSDPSDPYPIPAEPTCAPEYEGEVPYAPVCRPGSERWYFTADGCVEGCACTEGEEYYGWPAMCPPSYDDADACRSAHRGCTANCDRGDIGCRASEPACPPGQVAEVVGACWGECVSLRSCEPIACTEATLHHCPAGAACVNGFCGR